MKIDWHKSDDYPKKEEDGFSRMVLVVCYGKSMFVAWVDYEDEDKGPQWTTDSSDKLYKTISNDDVVCWTELPEINYLFEDKRGLVLKENGAKK